jgi:hypothetical protein
MIHLLLLAYIGNVFLNRWLNKKLIDKYSTLIWRDNPHKWFIPIYTTVIYLSSLTKLGRNLKHWFTGKHW